MFTIRQVSLFAAFLLVGSHFLANLYVIGDWSFNKLVSAVALAIWVVKKAGDVSIGRTARRFPPLERTILGAVVGYVVLSIVGLLWSADPVRSFNDRTLPLLMNLMVFFMLIDLLDRKEAVERCAVWLLAGTIAYSVVNLLQYFRVTDFHLLTTRTVTSFGESFRLVGLQQDPNYNAFMFVPVFPFMVYWMLRRTKYFVFLGIGVALSFLSVMLSYSRSMLIVTLLTVALILLAGKMRLRTKALLAAICTGGAIALMMVPGVQERLLSVGVVRQILLSDDIGAHMYVKGEGSLATRIAVLRSGLDAVARNPLFGIGTGDFRDEVGAEAMSAYGWSPAAHNSFLEIAAENGLPALALFSYALVGAIRALALRHREDGNPDCIAAAMSLVALVAIMLTLNVHQSRLFWILFAIGVAMPRALASAKVGGAPRARGKVRRQG